MSSPAQPPRAAAPDIPTCSVISRWGRTAGADCSTRAGVGGFPGELPIGFGAVFRVVEFDVAHAVQEPLDADLRFDTRQRTSRAGVHTAAESDVFTQVFTVDAEFRRAFEAVRVAVDRAGRIATGVPAGRSIPRSVVFFNTSRKSVFTGLSIRRVSSMNAGMRSRSSRSCFWMSGRSARTWMDELSSRAVVSWPAANRKVANRTTSMTSGRVPSGKVAVARSVRTSARGSCGGPRCSR